MQAASALLSRILITLCCSYSLSSCFYAPTASQGKVTVLDPTARPSQAKLMTTTKAVYAIDPQTKSDTLISAPSGALTGSSITIPTGALAVATDLVFEQAAPIAETSLVSSLGVTAETTVTPVGSGLVIRPSSEVELLGTLMITLPLSEGAGLLLKSKNYAVFYKQYKGGGLQDGVIPGKDLQFNDDGTVSFEGYFGAYWLVELSAPVEAPVEVKSAEPIVNYQKVAVIEQGGIVEDAVVQAKGEKPLVAWEASQLTFDTAQRSVTLVARVKDSAPLTACKADFFTSTDASSGELVETGAKTQATLVISKLEAHSLFGRVRCLDEEGRLTISPWSSRVDVPAVAAVAEEKGVDENFSESDVSLPKVRVQSRELLKLILSPELAASTTGFRIMNTTTDAELYDSSKSEATPRLKRQKLSDGRQLFSFQLSALGQLEGYIMGSNVLSVQSSDGRTFADLTVTLRDFPLFESVGITSFSQPVQAASDGFQGWGSVFANPVVSDKGDGQTRLGAGMLSIINP